MRKRMISPEFWTDSKIVSLSVPARLLYIGLWMYADDAGLFIEDLKSIKMILFPDQDFPLQKSYEELRRSGFFQFGTLNDKVGVKILHFVEHQALNHPSASKLPIVFSEESLSTDGGLTLNRREENRSVTVRSAKHLRTKEPDPAFIQFYQTYPRHQARADAEKAWHKLNPDNDLVATITQAAKLYADSSAGKELRYIALPATWLNGKRWEDDLSNVNGSDPNEEELPPEWQPNPSPPTPKE